MVKNKLNLLQVTACVHRHSYLRYRPRWVVPLLLESFAIPLKGLSKRCSFGAESELEDGSHHITQLGSQIPALAGFKGPLAEESSG